MSVRLAGRTRTIHTLVMVAVALCLGACGDRSAQGGLELRVGLYENRPKVFTDQAGHPAGLFVDLLEAMANEEGWRLRYVPCEWDACLRLLEQGELDVMPDVAWTQERAGRFDFHQTPVIYSWSQVYGAVGMDVRGMQDLAGLRIALVRDSVQAGELGKVLSGLDIPWTLVATASFDESFASVGNGRADVAVANNFFGSRNARRYGLTESTLVFNPTTMFYVVPRGQHAAVRVAIDHWMHRWQGKEGSIYFSAMARALAPEPLIVRPRWLVPALTMATALIVLLGAFALVLRWRVRAATATARGFNDRLDQVLATSPVVLAVGSEHEGQFAVEWVSGNAARLFGFDAGELARPGFIESRIHPEDQKQRVPLLALLREQPVLGREYRLLDAGGAVRHVREEMRAMSDATASGPLQVMATLTDLTASRAQEAELDYLSQHDALTGLPNRSRVQAELERALAAGRQCWLLMIDLDRLRRINDTLGHAMGDQALQVAAQRLKRVLPEDGLLARISGDEFAVLLPAGDADPDPDIEAFVNAAHGAFAMPLLAPEHMAVLAVRIGASRCPRDGDDAATLLQHAQLALHEAKRRPHRPYLEFEAAFSEGARRRMQIDSALRVALARREFSLHYQPQVDLRQRSLVGVEALLRWNNPELGHVPPDEFIAIAEENGLIAEIGHWVMVEAVRQLRAWDDAGLQVPVVAVNCSVRQLDPDRLPTRVKSVLAAARLEPCRLELEITESMLMQEPDRAIAVLNALQAHGVRLAIDDFGTGYSSLAYLRQLPVTRLKIDRSFVHGIGQHDNEQICQTVIALAHSLRLETLAEGVEHDYQAQFLCAAGCSLAQGYLYSPPLPAPALTTWLAGGAQAFLRQAGP